MSRPVVLVFLNYYLPGYKAGGPVRSIAVLAERLGDEFDFRIVTADRDMGDGKRYSGVVADGWSTLGKARVFYVSPRRRSLLGFARLMRETPHDVLYVNSFFNPVFTILPLLARALRLAPRTPAVIAPRGEFSRGALGLKSWRKLPFIRLSMALGLYRDITWQASSDSEAEDIRRVVGGVSTRIIRAQQVAVAPDLADPGAGAEPECPMRAADEWLRVVFLSRIARMKNLDYALRVLAHVHCHVRMSIYGVPEDQAYWRECRSIIEGLGPNITVSLGGSVPHDAVAGILASHDVFFLPTQGENYGHVIYEALAVGLPVLISDRTPWKNLRALGIGWDLPLDEPEAFAAVIDSQAGLTREERAAQRIRVKEYAGLVASDDDAVERNRGLFGACVGLPWNDEGSPSNAIPSHSK